MYYLIETTSYKSDLIDCNVSIIGIFECVGAAQERLKRIETEDMFKRYPSAKRVNGTDNKVSFKNGDRVITTQVYKYNVVPEDLKSIIKQNELILATHIKNFKKLEEKYRTIMKISKNDAQSLSLEF